MISSISCGVTAWFGTANELTKHTVTVKYKAFYKLVHISSPIV